LTSDEAQNVTLRINTPLPNPKITFTGSDIDNFNDNLAPTDSGVNPPVGSTDSGTIPSGSTTGSGYLPAGVPGTTTPDTTPRLGIRFLVVRLPKAV